ncbi:hypothetical protein PL18_14305 [Vibrio renipiscarius]|uniref:Uncharacterized protein n=1 Tax=Vibrio renipiscarius TaxID=1461322 RepID=A0A0C2NEX3_9VIBR|nr:hypothetical protein OJ16_16265 [Vibrio renipiscarius]KII78126.1 hypothetical protein PL18_14305 [Vibrio renipiscarius]
MPRKSAEQGWNCDPYTLVINYIVKHVIVVLIGKYDVIYRSAVSVNTTKNATKYDQKINILICHIGIECGK